MVMLSSTMSTRDEQGTGERGLSAVVECSGMLFFSPNLLAVCWLDVSSPYMSIVIIRYSII